MKKVTAAADGVLKVLPVYCTAGLHRSDTVMKCAERRVFNVAFDDRGHRMFTCQTWTCSNFSEDDVIDDVATPSVDFVRDNSRRPQRAKSFGVEASQVSDNCNVQLDWVDTLVRIVESDDPPSVEQDVLDFVTLMPYDSIDAHVGDDDQQHTSTPREAYWGDVNVVEPKPPLPEHAPPRKRAKREWGATDSWGSGSSSHQREGGSSNHQREDSLCVAVVVFGFVGVPVVLVFFVVRTRGSIVDARRLPMLRWPGHHHGAVP